MWQPLRGRSSKRGAFRRIDGRCPKDCTSAGECRARSDLFGRRTPWGALSILRLPAPLTLRTLHKLVRMQPITFLRRVVAPLAAWLGGYGHPGTAGHVPIRRGAELAHGPRRFYTRWYRDVRCRGALLGGGAYCGRCAERTKPSRCRRRLTISRTERSTRPLHVCARMSTSFAATYGDGGSIIWTPTPGITSP